jgi:hypothetical protein
MLRVPLLIGSMALAVLASGTAVAGQSAFGDTSGNTHEAAVSWLAGTGITSGCSDGRFCPDAPVTRGQMASFLRRLAGHDPAVPASVDAATVGGLTAEELRAGPRLLGQAASTAPATIDEYASLDTSVPVVELRFDVPSGITQMVQLLITYDESSSSDGSVAPDCGGGVEPEPSAPRLRLDGLRVYEVYAGAHPAAVDDGGAGTTSEPTRLAYTFLTTLAPGRHAFALSLEGQCGDTGSAGGGVRTIENARLSLLNAGAFPE